VSPDRFFEESPGPSPSVGGPGNSVGFALSQLGLETARRFGELVGTVGLEPRHFAVMRAVHGAESPSQQVVGEYLAIPASTMVAIIDHLESSGLVERRLHPTDRRTRTLHLTAKGEELLSRAMVLALGLETTICEGLSSTERLELLGLLRRLASNLDIAIPAVPDGGRG
jgi:DNA-binding MarR family transcriptional regulator